MAGKKKGRQRPADDRVAVTLGNAAGATQHMTGREPTAEELRQMEREAEAWARDNPGAAARADAEVSRQLREEAEQRYRERLEQEGKR